MWVLIFIVSFLYFYVFFFFCKQKTAYELRISDWSSDVCSSDLGKSVDVVGERVLAALAAGVGQVLAVARLGRPALVLVVAMGAQPVAHPVGERRQAVA